MHTCSLDREEKTLEVRKYRANRDVRWPRTGNERTNEKNNQGTKDARQLKSSKQRIKKHAGKVENR